MKLWRSKKPSSCVSSKSNVNKKKNVVDNKTNADSIPMTPNSSGDRAMSPAQSEDSGLAPERGTTYTTISLPRESVQALEIEFSERPDISYPPIIGSVNATGPAADFLSPGDRIHQVDGISTIGLSDEHIIDILCRGDGPAIVEIEYSLPEYISQNSLCVQSKLAQITVEREDGCLGLTLRGGGENPLLVTHVRPHGPVFKTGRIKPGDRLLRVDNLSLINKTLSEAQQLLKCGHISGLATLTIEYDVSVMQSLEYAMGSLLIEIERPLNDKLGLVLSNYSPIQDLVNLDEVSLAGVYIASIIPASISDRCGALSIGDQIIAVDDNVLEDSGYTPEDAMALLDANTGRGYTQIQILPVHSLRRREIFLGSQKYGYNTLDSSRKSSINRRMTTARKSSGGSLTPANIGVCRSETVQVILDCTQGSGLVLGAQSACGRSVIIAQVIEDSVADHSGCIQPGDRIIAVNKMYNLETNTIRQLLGDMGPRPLGYPGVNWVELELEFDMSDSVIPASGVFNIKLMKTGKAGLGITVNGSSHGGAFIISEVKPGSPAHRTGSLRAGDILLAVDSQPLQHFNVDALLKDNPCAFTTLTIRRDSIPDFLYEAQQRTLLNPPIYGNYSNTTGNPDRDLYGYNGKFDDVKYTTFGGSIKSATPQTAYYRDSEYDDRTVVQNSVVNIRKPFVNGKLDEKIPTIGRSFGAENTRSLETEVSENCYKDLSPYELDYPADRFMTLDSNCELPPPMENKDYETHHIVMSIRLEPKGGPLGITLAGSEDLNKSIMISGITEGGIANDDGQLRIGDCLLAINGESVQGMALSQATKLLQKNLDEFVDLKILRSFTPSDDDTNEGAVGQTPQPQAVYTKIQPRHRSSSRSTTSGSSKSSKHLVIHVTLYKDKVYDDYGFSLSDGLYEKGVFINRIRSGGPADHTKMLKSFDRIMKVNGTNTQDFDCCLTVPLIAAAEDKLDLIVQRPQD